MTKTLITVGAFTLLAALSVDASAAIRVKCETRSDRSRASVDGSNLRSGLYSSMITSGPNTAQSPQEQTVGDEVEFDFDSRAADIAEGAVAISGSFIQDGRVRGWLVNASGQRVTPVVTAYCRVRR